MGNNIIKAQSSFDTSVINIASNSFAQEATQVASKSVRANNEVIVDANNIKNCDIRIETITDVNVKGSLLLNLVNTSSVTTEFDTQITNDIAKQFQQQNENFGLGKNVAEDATKVSNFIQNTVRNTFTQATEQVYQTDTSVANKTKVSLNDVDCNGGEIIITSTLILNDITTVSADLVLDAMIKSTFITDILNKYNLTITQTNTVTLSFLLGLVFAALAFALIPVIVAIVEQVTGVSIGISPVKLCYATLLLGCVIFGTFYNYSNEIDFFVSVPISLGTILFTLLIFFGPG